MQRPKPDRPYWFVRNCDVAVEWLQYIRHDDGSASVLARGRLGGWDQDPNAWRLALEAIESDGWVLYGDAMESGALSADVRPSDSTSF